MDEYIITYLQDVLDAINELESYFTDYPMKYEIFEKDFLRRSAVERKVEIMGEGSHKSNFETRFNFYFTRCQL